MGRAAGDPIGWELPILAFDLETTDGDPHTCGIVQYGLALQTNSDAPIRLTGSYVNCPEEITDGARAVHGITDEQKASGCSVEEALEKIKQGMEWAMKHGALTVAFNLPYDWTVALRSSMRHECVPPPSWSLLALYDPLVVSRTYDRYRKGGHKLEGLLDTYDLHDMLTPGDAHNATRDAEAALLLTREQLAGFPPVQELPWISVTHSMQVGHQEWAENFEAYLRREKDPEARIHREWPIIPAPI